MAHKASQEGSVRWTDRTGFSDAGEFRLLEVAPNKVRIEVKLVKSEPDPEEEKDLTKLLGMEYRNLSDAALAAEIASRLLCARCPDDPKQKEHKHAGACHTCGHERASEHAHERAPATRVTSPPRRAPPPPPRRAPAPEPASPRGGKKAAKKTAKRTGAKKAAKKTPARKAPAAQATTEEAKPRRGRPRLPDDQLKRPRRERNSTAAANGAKANGAKANGAKANGAKANGAKANGAKTNGAKTDDPDDLITRAVTNLAMDDLDE